MKKWKAPTLLMVSNVDMTNYIKTHAATCMMRHLR